MKDFVAAFQFTLNNCIMKYKFGLKLTFVQARLRL